MIRKFYLENEYGQRWDLNNPTTGLLVNPSGLGYEMEYSYSRIGHSFVQNYLKDKLQKMTGTLVFSGELAYKNYAACTQFVNSAKVIKLVYMTDAGEYYRNVDVVKIGKSELTENRTLEPDITFVCKGLFYSNQTDRFIVSRTEGEMRWDFTWPVRFKDYDSRSMFISNNGHVPAAIQIEICGYCENPSVVVKQGDEEVYRLYLPITLQVGEVIYYSSLDGELYCYKIDADGNETNLADILDINNANFFKLPIGESRLEISSDTGALNQIVLAIYRFYRAV